MRALDLLRLAHAPDMRLPRVLFSNVPYPFRIMVYRPRLPLGKHPIANAMRADESMSYISRDDLLSVPPRLLFHFTRYVLPLQQHPQLLRSAASGG